MAKKPAKKKPVKKSVRKPRPKEEFLSDVLIKKLTKAGYCFDPVHEEDSKKAQEKLAATEKEISDLKTRSKGELETASKALQDEVRDRADRLFELESQKEKIEEDLKAAQETIAKMKADVNLAMNETIKQLKADGRCFDIMHKSVDGSKGVIASPIGLISFGRRMISHGRDSGAKVVMFVPRDLEAEYQKAISDEDALVNELVKRAGEMLANRPKEEGKKPLLP